MNNLSLVAELLSQAEWAVLKTPDCGYAVHQRLHRSLGRLHTITRELDAALFDFGNDVWRPKYYSHLEIFVIQDYSRAKLQDNLPPSPLTPPCSRPPQKKQQQNSRKRLLIYPSDCSL